MQDAKVEIQQWGAAHFGCAALCTVPSYEQFVISDGYLQPEQPDLAG